MQHEMNQVRRAIKFTINRYPEIKAKTKDATNTDSWGPSSQQKEILSDACYHEEDKELVMRALWKRIGKAEKNIQVVKALDCFEYILIHGPPSILSELRENRAIILGASNIEGAAKRVERLLELIDSAALLQQEREKAERIRSKMTETETRPVAPIPINTTNNSSSPRVSPPPASSPTTVPTPVAVVPPKETPAAPAVSKGLAPPPTKSTTVVVVAPTTAQPQQPQVASTTTTAPQPQRPTGVNLDDLFNAPVPVIKPTTSPPPQHIKVPETFGVSAPAPQKTLVDLDNLFAPQQTGKDNRSLNAIKQQDFAFMH